MNYNTLKSCFHFTIIFCFLAVISVVKVNSTHGSPIGSNKTTTASGNNLNNEPLKALENNPSSAEGSGSGSTVQPETGKVVYSIYGTTLIKVNKTVMFVVVDKNNSVSEKNNYITSVKHLDFKQPCVPVSSVQASYLGPTVQLFGECNPNACVFDYPQCTITPLNPPIIYENDYIQQCRTPERSKNGWKGNIPLAALTVTMKYADGRSDILQQLYTDYSLTCEAVPCTPLNLFQFTRTDYPWLPKGTIGKPYSGQLYSGGYKASITSGNVGLPPGLYINASGNILGTPSIYARGEWKMNFTITDNCPWNKMTKEITATLKIVDPIKPVLKELSIFPLSYTADGGELVLQVKASDNIAVFRVTATETRSDGHVGTVIIPLASGTPADGLWRTKWMIWRNNGNTPQNHLINVKIEDADGNIVEAFPIKITVAGRTTAPQIPQKPTMQPLRQPVKY